MTDPAKNQKHLSTYKTELEVQLTPEELHTYSKRLALIEQEMAQHEEFAKSKKAELAAKAAALKAERSNVALKVRSEKEPRLVTCSITAHFDRNVAITTRDDTGEIISERALVPAERQEMLVLENAEKAAEVANDLLAEAKKKPEPVITSQPEAKQEPKKRERRNVLTDAEPCTATTLGGLCTVHGENCPNPETIAEREARAKED